MPTFHFSYWLGLQQHNASADASATDYSAFSWTDPYAPDLHNSSSYSHWVLPPPPPPSTPPPPPSPPSPPPPPPLPSGGRRLLSSSLATSPDGGCGVALLLQAYGLAASWVPQPNCSALHTFIVKIRGSCLLTSFWACMHAFDCNEAAPPLC